MSLKLTPNAIACREVATELSIDSSWVEKRYTQLKSEYRAPFPVNANLFDWLSQSTQQNPKAALSQFFGFEGWEEQCITTNEGNPFESTLKLGEQKFVASHEIKEIAIQRVMRSALSFLVQDHPVHFNRFRTSYVPSVPHQLEGLQQGVSVDHLTRLLGRENFYIGMSKTNFMPTEPKPADSLEADPMEADTIADPMEIDTIEVQMHLKDPEQFPGENWKSRVVAIGTANNPISARDQAAEAFSKRSNQVQSLKNCRNYPEICFNREGALSIHNSAPNLESARSKAEDVLRTSPHDPAAKASLKIAVRDQAAEAFLKISARDQAAEAYLKTLDLPVKQYFRDLSKKTIMHFLPSVIADVVDAYLDGNWLGYSNDAVYLTADVRPYVEEPEPKACVIS